MLTVAFAGCGRVAQLHARAIARTRGVRLAGVYDPDARRCRQQAEAWDVSAYPSLESMLADDTVDAVWVLTPVAGHVPTGLAAVNAGKHVLVEKPVSHDPGQVRHLADQANARNLIALPGHNYLQLPEARRLLRQVHDGDLGYIRALFVTYTLGHTEQLAALYGPVLTELMIHHAYITLAILGVPTRVAAGAATPGWTSLPTSDQAWMTWEYEHPEHGATRTAHLFATFAVDDYGATPQTFTVKALGTHGSASLDWRAVSHRSTAGGYAVGLPLYEETYEHEVRAFRDVVLGEDLPVSDMYAAATAAQVLAAAARAAQTHASLPIHVDAVPQTTGVQQ